MTTQAAAALAAGHELAQLYAEAVKDLNRHWADEDGYCLACPGEPYPCPEEWITQRAITGIETRWRREGLRLAEARRVETPGATGAPGRQDRETDMTNLNGATWRRSSLCDNSGGSCVEVAFLGDTIITRDSKDPQGTVQTYTRIEWAQFVEGVRLGEFDV